MFDPDDFQLEDLDRVAEQSKRAVQRLSGVLGELRTIKGVGEAADGLVGAVVDGGGQIQEVTLDPRAMRLDSRSIAEAVTEAVRAAQQDARRRNDALLRDAMGGELAFDPQNLDGVQSWLEDAARSMKDSWPH
ncbi:YbaB/EbfC family nucleoid-associated protein [Sphaerisporangium sp. NPDC051017]|uniref:YbaB/EbfC family nucleoid-associated protein n=1 Tax=Sphaerisporangium sp. NPDC051017 TaxID=3154636 RepID=UPI003442145A